MWPTKLLARLPEGWRIGKDGDDWIVEIGLVDDERIEVGRDPDLNVAVGLALTKFTCCPTLRCTAPYPVDRARTSGHRHQLRPKSPIEELWERAYQQTYGDLGPRRGQRIDFPIFDNLRPSS